MSPLGMRAHGWIQGLCALWLNSILAAFVVLGDVLSTALPRDFDASCAETLRELWCAKCIKPSRRSFQRRRHAWLAKVVRLAKGVNLINYDAANVK